MFPEDIQELEDLGSAVICRKEDEDKELRLAISHFRGKNYLSLRWWRLSLDEEWFPTKEGVTMEYKLSTVGSLFDGLCSLLSQAEVMDRVIRYIEEQKNESDSSS